MKHIWSSLIHVVVAFVIVCAAAVRADAQSLVPLYEYRYGSLEDFYYTTNYGDLGGGGGGWTLLGIDSYIYDAQAEGTVPLYKFYSPTYGKHFYTTNYNDVGAPHWTFEGTTGYILTTQESGTLPLRRWFKWVGGGPVHIYTTYTGDDSTLSGSGWEFEGAIGYAVPCTSSC